MRKPEKRRKNKILITIIIIFIISMLFVGYTFAKSIESVMIKATSQIAEPILVIENDPSLDITAIENEATYNFTIKNYNENEKITDIKLKYYIELSSNVDESIDIKLYEHENEIQLNENITEYIEVSNKEKEEKQYQIKVKYDESKSESISEIMEKIQVRVHAEQVKA
ncbi:MAG: hypothetical protein HFJ59_07565 [Clostridia bacterium]|nr:hypothetical protein [Clostridia bacterium]